MDTYSPEAIAMLTEMCNCDQDTALFLMESANGDIDAAMDLYISMYLLLNLKTCCYFCNHDCT